MRKFDAAVKEYNELIRTSAQPSLAYAGLSRALLKLHKLKEAYAAAVKAVELGPDLADAHTALAEILYRQGRIPEAEDEYLRLIQAQTLDARAYLGMAKISEAASLRKQAKELIDRAHDLDRSDPEIRLQWLARYSLPDQVNALQDYLSSDSKEVALERPDLENLLKNRQETLASPTHPCRIVSRLTSAEIDLKAESSQIKGLHGYGLSVQINGIPANLLLDTGASGVLLTHKFAKKAGITSDVKITIGGVGDQNSSKGYSSSVAAVKVDGIEFQDCLIQVEENDQINDTDGIIGAEMFSRFLVDLDFPRSKLRLSELPLNPEESASSSAQQSADGQSLPLLNRYIDSQMKSFTPVYEFGPHLAVWTKLNDSIPQLFVIDTGSTISLVSTNEAQKVTNVTRSRLGLEGLNGSVSNVLRGGPVTLVFGGIRQKNTDITAFDMTGLSDAEGTEISGLLGISVLRLLEVKIDYRDGLVEFIPEGKPN